MMTADLIASAELLINRPGSEPTQADINRAASTLYYALFHELSKTCANLFMGEMREDYRRAWQQVYRALAHENTKSRCRDFEIMKKFPDSIQEFATQFVTLQELRHQCDYDPLSKTPRTTVETEFGNVIDVVNRFAITNELDLRAFCSFVLFPKREDPLRKQLDQEKEEEAAKAKIAAQIAAQPIIAAERAAKKAAKAAQEVKVEAKDGSP